MVKKGKLSRRSFLTRVVGGVAIAGAVGSITGGALAQNRTGRTDSDTGSSADRAGYGRTGVTDSDSGGNSDRAGYGRGGGSTADRGGSGRNCSDSDSGSGADPGGRGRRCSDSDG